MFDNISKTHLYIGLAFGILIMAYGIREMTNNRTNAVSETINVVREQTAPANIIVSARPITRGAPLSKDDLTSVQPTGSRPANAEMSIASLVGKFAVADIQEGAVILSTQVASDPAAAGLAVMVPVGYRAIEMRTTDEIAVGNFLRPGDHVDLELVLRENVLPKQTDARQAADGNPSESNTVLQNVQVLAIGDTLSSAVTPPAPQETASGRKVEPPHAVTLAMTPDQISRFMLASSLGTIHLALRNPTDPQTITVGAVTLGDIRGAPPPGAGAISQGNRPIELIIGNKMHHIFSSNPNAK
jgi:pilus assembly protein CpaB